MPIRSTLVREAYERDMLMTYTALRCMPCVFDAEYLDMPLTTWTLGRDYCSLPSDPHRR